MIGKKILRWLISIATIIAIFIIILLTPLGLKLGLTVADLILPGKISYQHASGIITGPIEIKHLKYISDKELISIDKLKLKWNLLQLFHRKIVIHELIANNVHVTMQLSQKSNGFTLPAAIEIKKARIHGLSIGTAPNQYPTFIRTIKLNAHINTNKIYLRFSADMTKPFPLKTLFNISGTPNHYTIKAHAFSPKLSWHLNGSGNAKGLSLKLNEGKTLGGQLSFNAMLRWATQPIWNVKLNGTHLNFSELDPNWPKQFSIKLATQGRIQNNKTKFDLTTQIAIPDGNIHIKAIQKHQLTLDWDIAIKQLSHLYKPYKGSLNTKGTWTLNAFAFQLTSANLQVPGIPLQSMKIQGSGSERSHVLQGSATVASSAIHFKMNGGFLNEIWHGQLDTLNISSAQYHNWKLIKTARITISRKRISTDDFCLQSGMQGRFCLTGNWDAKAAWQFNADGQKFNPVVLLRFFIPKLTLSSTASLRVTAFGKGSKIQSAKANILLQKGNLRYQLNGNYLDTPIQQGNINISLLQTNLTTSAQLSFSKKNTLELSATLPHFSITKLRSSQRIKGRIKLNLSDLSPFNKIVKDIAEPSGTVTANLSIGGTLKTPDVRGRISLKNGRIAVPRYGVVFTKINTSISSFSANTLKYKIVAYSKNKPIRVEGETKATAQGLQTTATIKATNAMLINNSEYTVYSSPDIKIKIIGHSINVNGSVDIPQAIIQPHEIANVEKLPNNEIVYTAGEPITKQTTWKITANIMAKLGKSVTVNTSGFTADVTGQTLITGKPGKTTIANGRIDVIKGKYSNFGTTLIISPGSFIQFINSPIDNPILNISAIKKVQIAQSISGQQLDSNEVTVGAHLRGTFRHPKISFFSIPGNLSQADIISYLVLGSSSSSVGSNDTGSLLKAASAVGGPGAGIGGTISELKQGLGLSELGVESQTLMDAIGTPLEQQTAFVIGKRLTQNIYIRYSYGLGQGPFVPVNIFQVQYRFNDHWSVQSTSSTLGSGGDVLYTIQSD